MVLGVGGSSTCTLYGQTTVDSSAHYYQLAMRPKKGTDLVSAYTYFVKHKEHNLKNNYTEGAIYDLIMLTIIQKESGFYHDSETAAIEAIRLLDQMEASDFAVQSKLTLYNELGKINRGLREFDRALLYYDKAFAITKKPEDFNKLYNNKAVIFIETERYDKALLELQKAYDISVRIKDEMEIARNLDNLGFVASKLEEPLALTKLKEALAIRHTLNDVEGLFSSYRHLSDYYKDRSDLPTARRFLDSALQVSYQVNSDSYKMNVLSEYMELEEDSLITAYKQLNDKIQLDNRLADNKFASEKYDYTKNEMAAQKSKLETQQAQFIIGLLLIIAMFSYMLLRARHKKKTLQQVFTTETRISKKIHDELANDVSDLMNYVENELQTSTDTKTTLLNALEAVYVRTRDISTEIASVDFVNFSESLKNLLIQHNKPHVKIIINDVNTIQWESIHHHKKLAVYRCLQELMVNMKKYSNAQLVTIVFKSMKHDHEIRYTDDGIGCDIDTVTKNGLLNAESRMKDVGGTLTFETSEGHGFKALLVF